MAEPVPRDTLLQLELSWMGCAALRHADGEGGSLELPVKRPAETSTEIDSCDSEVDTMLEYLELVAPAQASDSDGDEQDGASTSANPEAAHAMAMLNKKELECEHLRQIIKELVQSRAHIARTSAEVQHRYCSLQAEFCKARKVADLARIVSQQHMKRHSQMRKDLQDAKLRAYRAEQQIALLRQSNADLKLDVAEYKHKVSVLERLHSWDTPSHAACFHQFPFVRQVALY